MKKDKLILIGAGGHAKSCIDIIKSRMIMKFWSYRRRKPKRFNGK